MAQIETQAIELNDQNRAKILGSLERMLSAVQVGSIQQTERSYPLKYDLSFASYYAPRIKQLCAIPGAAIMVEDIIFAQISELSKFLTSRADVANEIEDMTKTIVSRYGIYLSISAVAHWVTLIQTMTPPFDKDLHGFDRRALLGLLWEYIQLQKAWISDHEAKNDKDATSLAERENLLANVIRKNPEIKKKVEELRKKLEIKYPSIGARPALTDFRNNDDPE